MMQSIIYNMYDKAILNIIHICCINTPIYVLADINRLIVNNYIFHVVHYAQLNLSKNKFEQCY